MKSMTKGAVITTLGVALLLGGGGTLAVWNAEQDAKAGTIAAGDLNLTAGTGKWTSNLTGAIGNVSEYRIIPGEVLTYRQPVTITMDGNSALRARLSVTGINKVSNGFSADTLRFSDVKLVNAQGESGWDREVKAGTYTASGTLTFQANGQKDMGKTLDLRSIGYRLEQIPPTPVNATAPAPTTTTTPANR
jgi:alternate signal-mediated exported protein